MTAYKVAERHIGIKELAGADHHPLIQWWLSLCAYSLKSADEIPWCSAFCNGVAWLLDLPRSKSASARSWLTVGAPVALEDAKVGFDVVVLKRGSGSQPGPDVLNAQGHVGFYAGRDQGGVWVLGGNQSNAVTRQQYPATQVLGIRRLA